MYNVHSRFKCKSKRHVREKQTCIWCICMNERTCTLQYIQKKPWVRKRLSKLDRTRPELSYLVNGRFKKLRMARKTHHLLNLIMSQRNIPWSMYVEYAENRNYVYTIYAICTLTVFRALYRTCTIAHNIFVGGTSDVHVHMHSQIDSIYHVYIDSATIIQVYTSHINAHYA